MWSGSASAGTDTSFDKGMRPLTLLLGIVMGSTVSLAVGLLGTWIIILFLPQQAARFAHLLESLT